MLYDASPEKLIFNSGGGGGGIWTRPLFLNFLDLPLAIVTLCEPEKKEKRTNKTTAKRRHIFYFVQSIMRFFVQKLWTDVLKFFCSREKKMHNFPLFSPAAARLNGVFRTFPNF